MASNKKFNCSLCDLGFNRKSNLKRHERNAHGIHILNKHYYLSNECFVKVEYFVGNKDEFFCEKCTKVYQTKVNLMLHQSKAHSTAKQQRFQCDVCNKEFVWHRSMQIHIRQKHTLEKRWCKECGKHQNIGNFQRHTRQCKGVCCSLQ